MTSKGNGFSNAKMIFLIAFACIALAWFGYEVRHGNDLTGPGIFLAFLVAIALIFKPWRPGSDEGSTF